MDYPCSRTCTRLKFILRNLILWITLVVVHVLGSRVLRAFILSQKIEVGLVTQRHEIARVRVLVRTVCPTQAKTVPGAGVNAGT
jgi:hypothetical protein